MGARIRQQSLWERNGAKCTGHSAASGSMSEQGLPQQLLADFFTIRSVDVGERPVRLCFVHRAAPFDPQSFSAKSSFSLPLAISASFRSLMHLACDPISGVSMPETNGTPSPSSRLFCPLRAYHPPINQRLDGAHGDSLARSCWIVCTRPPKDDDAGLTEILEILANAERGPIKSDDRS
ncbi:hypothetical protein [Rhizobium phaseoli]|uniref:hypothetical protein n=1 Tax=Rhizobium phaseoli TaxID=396 RepID=UPI001677118E|nr:hypothetical protein [Rhizobium phaseoli]